MDKTFKQMSLDELRSFVESRGLPSFRFSQLASWAYQKGSTSYDEMTTLPKALRQELADELISSWLCNGLHLLCNGQSRAYAQPLSR